MATHLLPALVRLHDLLLRDLTLVLLVRNGRRDLLHRRLAVMLATRPDPYTDILELRLARDPVRPFAPHLQVVISNRTPSVSIHLH